MALKRLPLSNLSDSVMPSSKSEKDAFPYNLGTAPLPKQELKHVTSLLLLLSQIDSALNDFEEALALFNYVCLISEPSIRSRYGAKWAIIAGTQAMLCAWHIGEALRWIEIVLRSCPTLKKAMGGKYALKPATGLFGATFRDLEEIRNSDAHIIERLASARGRVSASLAPGVIADKSLDGRRIYLSRDMREVSFEVSNDALDTLHQVRNMIFRIFRETASRLSDLEKPNPS
jgi:hypothetical protein